MNDIDEQLNEPVGNLVILGGGTAGWMAAAAIGKVFQNTSMQITVVESSQIGTVGVGEATIPEIINFNNILGLDEKEFLKFTQGTFKLGIEFKDWLRPNHAYFHPFGRYGNSIGSVPFFHHWQKARNAKNAPPLADFSLAIGASYANKFSLPVNIPNSPLSEIGYAYHFDAGLYAEFLKRHALKWGVKHLDAKVEGVNKSSETGDIESLQLDSGDLISGDLFIDCSGFRGVLIEKALHSGYEDWSHLLPCNSAVTVASERLNPLPPYTRAQAHDAGWQWRIPLQHRTGNGYVYSDKFITDSKAQETLLSNIEGPTISDPRIVRFTTGIRRTFWNKNCVAIGLSGGFLEPLESTSIHLIHEGIANFLGLFPNKKIDPELRKKFNQLQVRNFTNVRDLLIFHYWATERRDSDFWRYCSEIDIPDRLRNKVELYLGSGRIFREDNELFSDTSWVSVFQGQGVQTEHYNPIADAIPNDALHRRLSEIRQVIQSSIDRIPSHDKFIERYCKFDK